MPEHRGGQAPLFSFPPDRTPRGTLPVDVLADSVERSPCRVLDPRERLQLGLVVAILAPRCRTEHPVEESLEIRFLNFRSAASFMCASNRRCCVTARPRTSCASARRSWVDSVCLTPMALGPALRSASVRVFEQTTRIEVFSARNATDPSWLLATRMKDLTTSSVLAMRSSPGSRTSAQTTHFVGCPLRSRRRPASTPRGRPVTRMPPRSGRACSAFQRPRGRPACRAGRSTCAS